MAHLTKSGSPDMRRKENRQRAAQMPKHEIVQMIRLVLPAQQAAARAMKDAADRIAAFRAEHPELAEMERAFAKAMEASNEAVLPLWGLLNKLREQDSELHQEWCDYLNGETKVMPS